MRRAALKEEARHGEKDGGARDGEMEDLLDG